MTEIPTKKLEAELKKRKDRNNGTCPTCNHWAAYMGCSDSWAEKLHCFGCSKPVANCTCR